MSVEIKSILREIKSVLAQVLLDKMKDVILFGSRASGNYKPESDYDILIIIESNNDWKIKRLIFGELYKIELKYGILIDTRILSQEELNSLRGKQPIYLNAISNGIYA